MRKVLLLALLFVPFACLAQQPAVYIGLIIFDGGGNPIPAPSTGTDVGPLPQYYAGALCWNSGLNKWVKADSSCFGGGGGGGNLSGTLTTNSPLYGSAAHTVSSLPANVFGNVLFDGLGGVPTIVPPYAPFITEPPYNAKCDGSTDDSAAIQAAADANGAIQFPVPTAATGLIQCNIATGLIQNNPSLVIYGNDDLISYTGSGTGITDNPAGSLTIHNLYFSLANATGTPTELSSSGILLLDFFDDYGDGPAGYTALNYTGFSALVTLINSQPDVAVLAGGNLYSLVNSDFNTSLTVGAPGGNGPAKFNFSNTAIGDVTWNSADVFGNVNITGTQADAPGSGQLCQTLNSINPVCTNFSPTALLNLPATTKADVVGIDPSTGALTKQAAGGGNLVSVMPSVTPTGCTVSAGVCTVSGTPASIILDTIPGTFQNLLLNCTLQAATASSGGVDRVLLVFNADTAANYDYGTYGIYGPGGSASIDAAHAQGAASMNVSIATDSTQSSKWGLSNLWISRYASTSGSKPVAGTFSAFNTSVPQLIQYISNGGWNNSAALTSITLTLISGHNFAAGSQCTLDGQN